MPENTERQRRRRRDAIFSAWFYTLLSLASAILWFALRQHYAITGFWGTVLLMISLLDLGIIIPIHILLKERLKEIEGGEEDAAAQY